tara:strand:- start:4956 stop:5600 length:645 start_codon:yes stop_codon:yes gene_type:complete
MEIRSLFLTGLLALALAAPVSSQEATEVVGSLSLHLQGGISTDPAGFDAFRNTTFGIAPAIGGGFTYVLYPNIAIRGDFHYSPKRGNEKCCDPWTPGDGQGVTVPGNPGSIDEPVDLNRNYYGMSVVFRFPQERFVPYLKGGAGFVDIVRDAYRYQYDFAEFGAQLGAGVSVPIAENVAIFADATRWIYARVGTGEGDQHDTLLSVGLSYTIVQ